MIVCVLLYCYIPRTTRTYLVAWCNRQGAHTKHPGTKSPERVVVRHIASAWWAYVPNREEVLYFEKYILLNISHLSSKGSAHDSMCTAILLYTKNNTYLLGGLMQQTRSPHQTPRNQVAWKGGCTPHRFCLVGLCTKQRRSVILRKIYTTEHITSICHLRVVFLWFACSPRVCETATS